MELVKEKNIDEYLFSTDKSLLDIKMIHQYLCFESYWAKNVPIDILQAAIDNSLCFGIYNNGKQIG